MEWFEIVALIIFVSLCVVLLVYEFLTERQRHKAYMAERRAQIDLYQALLDEIRKSTDN